MVMQRWFPHRVMATWRPLRELQEMEQRFEDLFGRTGEWMPAVDVVEKDDKFEIKAELPGLKEDEIDVSMTDNTITIRGEKKTDCEVKEEDYFQSECFYGSFYRTIPLPSNIDKEKIEADYKSGILEISVPKTAETKPKKITVGPGKAQKEEKKKRPRKKTK